MSAASKPRRCKDCGDTGRRPRPAPYPGPRCATHHRERQRASREARHSRHVERTYGISREQYGALLEAQGGRCAGGCGATGKSRRLAVDHDHSCCPGTISCGRCVRGLLCSRCNRFIGHLGDNPEALRGLAEYLENPPARRVLGLTNTERMKR